ncbi:MAG: ECF transporter S component [Clostridia bacterium]|nr:ECF transporter S component [Clostridia bacterium]MDD4049008.1 ECF transporter S component [Clostridia bacterium]
MSKFKTKQLAVTSLMTALVIVGTMVIQIPTPTKGYIHIGDSMVYLCGFLLGPLAGFLAASTGSAMADLFSGYGFYAPATFFIKGFEALMVSYCYRFFQTKAKSSTITKVIGSIFGIIIGGIIMVLGYLTFETYLYGYPTALVGVAANITQAVGGGILAFPLNLALEKADLLKKAK